MKFLLVAILFASLLNAKNITPNDVFAKVMQIESDVYTLLQFYGVSDESDIITDFNKLKTKLKPRNTWQKTYEILVKINMLREANYLPRIEPIGMEPVINLNPDMVYEQTVRILAELEIFKIRKNIKKGRVALKTYKNKTPLDVFNELHKISMQFDILNRSSFTPSYVFAETIRVHEDLTLILSHLNINDQTIPSKRDENATPSDTFEVAMKTIKKIQELQFKLGIKIVDFSSFKRDVLTPSDVFSITQMILAELQPIKAYIGLKNDVTTPALKYIGKTPSDVDQLMNWNLRRIELIQMLGRI